MFNTYWLLSEDLRAILIELRNEWKSSDLNHLQVEIATAFHYFQFLFLSFLSYYTLISDLACKLIPSYHNMEISLDLSDENLKEIERKFLENYFRVSRDSIRVSFFSWILHICNL